MSVETYRELTENRLILLLEQEPLTNKYNQLVLNEEQFKQVSNLISSFFTKVGEQNKIETILIKLYEENIELPEGLTSCE